MIKQGPPGPSRSYENAHIALWLVKDCCWVSGWHVGGMLMIVPTVLVALHLTWLSRKNRHDVFHNAAVTLWICANAIWMTGEFYFDDGLRPYAKTFFAAGMLSLAFYYGTNALAKMKKKS